MPGARELAVRTGADAQVVAELPVVEVVAALAARAGDRPTLRTARSRAPPAAPDIRPACAQSSVLVGQRRRLRREHRARLQRELIVREMRGLQRERRRDDPRSAPAQRLLGQRVHEIEIEIGEARRRAVRRRRAATSSC